MQKSLFIADVSHFYSVRQLKILQYEFQCISCLPPKNISPVLPRWYRIYTEQKLLIVLRIILSTKSATKNNRQNPGVIALHRKTCKFQQFYVISSLSSILNYNMWHTHIQNQQLHINKLYFLCTVQTTHIKKDYFCPENTHRHTHIYIYICITSDSG